MSNTTVCAYHPDRYAVNICERCRSPICANDLRVYRKTRTEWVGEVATESVESFNYCLPCFADQTTQDVNPSGVLIIASVIIVLFLAFFQIASRDFAGFFILFALAAVIITLVGYLNKKSKAEKAQSELMMFQQGLESYDKGSKRNSNTHLTSSHNKLEINCFQCGQILQKGDRFCNNCGDSTEDEKMVFGEF